MAQGLLIQGASPLVGSPITFKVQAAVISGECAFHRVKLTVHAGMVLITQKCRLLTGVLVQCIVADEVLITQKCRLLTGE